MVKISWTESKTKSEEVLRRIGENRTLMSTIYNRQKKCIMRHQGLLRNVIEGKINGKRSRGRKRMTLFDLGVRKKMAELKHMEKPSVELKIVMVGACGAEPTKKKKQGLVSHQSRNLASDSKNFFLA